MTIIKKLQANEPQVVSRPDFADYLYRELIKTFAPKKQTTNNANRFLQWASLLAGGCAVILLALVLKQEFLPKNKLALITEGQTTASKTPAPKNSTTTNKTDNNNKISQNLSSTPDTEPAKQDWQSISWVDPENPIIGYRFDDPTTWVQDKTFSERQITVASCAINSCDRMSFDVQVISGVYRPESSLPAGWTKTKITIDNIAADKVVKPTGDAIITTIDFMKEKNWFHLEFYTSKKNEEQATPIFNHILDTFKFEAAKEQQKPEEYDLFKNISDWSLIYQDKNTDKLVCSDGRKGDTGAGYVFTMNTGDDNQDIDTPYQQTINTLKNNGWTECQAIGVTEFQDTQSTSEVYIKGNKLIGIYRHYSMGTGNTLKVSIQY